MSKTDWKEDKHQGVYNALETYDIDLNILDDDVLPTSGIIVEEHVNIISRNEFIRECMEAITHAKFS